MIGAQLAGKIVLAVSGGLDSMVMLDLYARNMVAERLVVAHFNHGIRAAAKDDAIFVRTAAERYSVQYREGAAELGAEASEATARAARYDFLLDLARELRAELYTAQHFDDVIESIAINVLRGTGWRGLAVMGRKEVRRPLVETELLSRKMRDELRLEKATGSLQTGEQDERAFGVKIVERKTLVRYAAKHNVIFREDATNQEDKYLRGRLRRKLVGFNDKEKVRLAELFLRQKELRKEIEKILDAELAAEDLAPRAWAELEPEVARELIRALGQKNGLRLVESETEKLRLALKTLHKGAKVNLSGDRLIRIDREGFYLV